MVIQASNYVSGAAMQAIDGCCEQIDRSISNGRLEHIHLQLVSAATVEAVSERYTKAGWKVSYSAIGGRSGGFIFSVKPA